LSFLFCLHEAIPKTSRFCIFFSMKAFLIKSQNTISFMCFPLLFGLLDHFLTWLLWLRYNFRSRFLAPIKKTAM
jgi:hypothetical protein